MVRGIYIVCLSMYVAIDETELWYPRNQIALIMISLVSIQLLSSSCLCRRGSNLGKMLAVTATYGLLQSPKSVMSMVDSS